MKDPSRMNGFAVAAAILLAPLALLGGCEDDPAEPQVTPDPTVKVTITVKEVQVIAECEGTTGTNPGDFVFTLDFSTSDTHITPQEYSGSFSGLTGQTLDITDIVIELNRVPPKNGFMYMEFSVTELDNNVPDAGMNDSRGVGEYAWPAGDLLEETFVTQVSGSSRCRVLFVYTISAVRQSS